ncbi:histone-lysine N-methyltransferase 2B-like [Brachyhypopomus gauderio]|uniref:histone-lysine N-methyltransferase 2B-like n=1 Tax=Brachyhypopomus gauderio TaxID=698409 RepID=UPI004041DE50
MPGKSWDVSWNHDLDLCPDCSRLYTQGNFCVVCLKCYEEHKFDSKMLQCARCAHCVHPVLIVYIQILSCLRGKNLVFSCASCSKNFPSVWQDVMQDVLRAGLDKVMNGLRSSTATCHLQTCPQKAFHEDVVMMLMKRIQQEGSLPEGQRPTAHVKALYLKLLEQAFRWFNSQDPKV